MHSLILAKRREQIRKGLASEYRKARIVRRQRNKHRMRRYPA